ncbi:MAG: RluA family pseudouridine synthase [Kofleriaceae bacterium]|nr:RluA family pseudouridine synthase [Kofleriaceae bacterium]MBP9171267.1 RluA family pseudouridine synthase [Kofleriaceae bacterium]MBP9861864.1 RluA family pseudouridine synthase [Kofleriaceae bacterium]
MAAPRWFEPPPPAGAAPAVMPSPFADGAPHPLAARAAAELLRELAADPRPLDERGGGKMFGVLVVRDRAERLGYLRGFSGMLRGAWQVDGFAPPLFDPGERAGWWPAGEAELASLTRAADAAAARATTAEAALTALAARHRDERQVAAAAAAEAKATRAAARAAGGDLAALAEASRADGRAARALRAAHREALAVATAAWTDAVAERDRVAAVRAARSRALYQAVIDGYRAVDGRGAPVALADCYDGPPPGGAGDCAGPKLLGWAHRLGLRPVALAEFWWGPDEAGRIAGRFYPACRGKCGPLLPAMLVGCAVAPAPAYGDDPPGPDEPRVVHADRWLCVVDKPVGLLSVPGRTGNLRDSVATRLRARDPEATGPLVVHRLDLDTSGLLLCARDPDTHRCLAAAFARRAIAKRYVAILDGEVADDAGAIDLPLRLDPDDRPRQVVDLRHGKPASTSYRVVARGPGWTRVELVPHTGRTHQLRVHAAVGLGAPILGDRLYGRVAGPRVRLHLHAAGLGFVHPATGAMVELTSPVPF